MVSWAQEEGLVAWNGMVLTWDPSQTDMAIPKISQWWPSFDPRIVSWAEEGGWWPEMDAATQPSRLQTFTRSPPSLPPFVNFISFHISHGGRKVSKKKNEQKLTGDSLVDTHVRSYSELWVTRPAQIAELPRSKFDPELFPHSAYVEIFVTFATKVPYLTFCNKMWRILM